MNNEDDTLYSWKIVGADGKETNIDLTNLDAATVMRMGYTVTMNKESLNKA